MTIARRRNKPLADDFEEIDDGALLRERSLFVIGFYVGLGFLCAQLLFVAIALLILLTVIRR